MDLGFAGFLSDDFAAMKQCYSQFGSFVVEERMKKTRYGSFSDAHLMTDGERQKGVF